MYGIREATREDCDAIGEVHVAAWRETYAGLLPDATLAGLSPQRRADMWRRWCDARDPDRLLLVAEDDAGLSAFAACRRPAPSEPIGAEGEVTAIYVLRRAQRRGIGRELMGRLFAFMAGRGMASAGLWVLRENEGARAFYHGLGAAEGVERSEEADGHRHVELACVWRPLTA
ncbi:GNAT family N-acetyltransferase [Craurococcus roseus]|uniref:GNAT family N-acetyltransferase n=1 Tax=Craurococcus roseus TaxID=77585 RepID=A0ABN1G7A1_9PROT